VHEPSFANHAANNLRRLEPHMPRQSRPSGSLSDCWPKACLNRVLERSTSTVLPVARLARRRPPLG